MGFNIFKYEKAKVTLWEHHFRAFNREMVNISGLNLVNEASNATEVEMESCSESMAPGAWSSASPSLTIDKFKNDGHPKVNRFSYSRNFSVSHPSFSSNIINDRTLTT